MKQRHDIIYVCSWGSNGMLEQIGPNERFYFVYFSYVFIKQLQNDVTLLLSIDVTFNDVTFNDAMLNDATINDVTSLTCLARPSERRL